MCNFEGTGFSGKAPNSLYEIRQMRYIFLLITLMLIQLTSCGIRKENTTTLNNRIEDNQSVKLDFNILPKEVSFRGMKVMEYIESELLATIKHANLTNDSLRLYYHNSITFENYEIKNVNGEHKEDSLLQHYDYSIIFDPDTYEPPSITLEPNEFITDTLNLIRDFRFDLAKLDTFLIRVRKHHDEGFIYSNWDTLIIQ